MIVKRNLRWNLILFYSWKNVIFYALIALAAYALNKATGFTINIPIDGLAVFGTALAIFLGFKNNNAYDRWWEACQLWSQLVGESRTWARELIIFLSPPDPSDAGNVRALQQKMIYRQIAFVNALRVYLRRKNQYNKNQQAELLEVKNEYAHGREYLDEKEFNELRKKNNPPNYLLELQAHDLKQSIDRGWITDYCFVRLDETLAEFTDIQAGCERIKNTPFPRHYSFYSRIFVLIQSIMLPFALVGIMGAAMIPLSVVISFIFCSLDVIGERTEDPFENRLEDVPLNTICSTIEANLREQLGVPTHAGMQKVSDDILL